MCSGQFESVNHGRSHQTSVLLCDSPFQRLRGLLGREGKLLNSVLWLRPCSSVHTCFMRSPIDVIYLDGERRVLKTVSKLKPWRFSACPGAVSVLELANGLIDIMGLTPGDHFKCDF